MSLTTPGPHDRHLHLPGTRNLRDVGGYPAGDGHQTRWRTLLRSDALDQLPAGSLRALVDLGLRQAIDLRSTDEVEWRPSVFRDSPDVRYVNLPLRDTSPTAIALAEMLDEHGHQLTGVARTLLEPGRLPAVVSCRAGIDRTGLAIAIVLTAVGVGADVVAADYALSVSSYATDDRSELDDWRSGPIEIDCRPEYILGALDYLRRRHGGAGGYLVAHDMTEGDIRRLRELLTEPTSNSPA